MSHLSISDFDVGKPLFLLLSLSLLSNHIHYNSCAERGKNRNYEIKLIVKFSFDLVVGPGLQKMILLVTAIENIKYSTDCWFDVCDLIWFDLINREFTSHIFASASRWLPQLLPNSWTKRHQIYALHKVIKSTAYLIIRRQSNECVQVDLNDISIEWHQVQLMIDSFIVYLRLDDLVLWQNIMTFDLMLLFLVSFSFLDCSFLLCDLDRTRLTPMYFICPMKNVWNLQTIINQMH